jgi:predicted porin
MKKNVIALAVAAALAAPLAAQAEVSITGGLQAEVVSVSGDSALANGLYAMDGMEYGKESSGSWGFLKFSASEDLGGGMKALAMWNAAINVGDGDATGGSAGFGQRDSYVGLTGGFGTVLAGTLSTPYKSSTVKWDPFLTTAAQARGSFGMNGKLHNGYVSNVLAYANKFGPATVVAAVVLDETADATDTTKTYGKNALSFSVNAPVGPVEVAFAYIDASEMGVDGTPTAQAAKNSTATKIGVKWASGPITVAGQYEMIDKGYFSGGNDGDNVIYVTGSYAMGANTFSAGIGQTTEKNTGGADDVVKAYTALGMKHAFSKTTSAHVAFRSSTNDDAADNDESVITAGLRVGF